MARGTQQTRGTGKSLIGSNNRFGATPGTFSSDTALDGSDMLVEVLAEEFRHKRDLEFRDMSISVEELEAEDGDAEPGSPPPPKGPFMQHRKYLTHRGVGDGTIFKREAMAAQARMERAQESAYSYQLPAAFKAARREMERQRKHGGNLVEEAIVRAIADGQFDNLHGKGKRLKDDANPFVDAGTRAFNKILQRAGCAPKWVEENREIRTELRLLQLTLAARWLALTDAEQCLIEHDAGGDRVASERSRLRRIVDDRKHAWNEEKGRFTASLEKLNGRVRNHNVMAPQAAHMCVFQTDEEINKVMTGVTVYDEAVLRHLDDGSCWRLRDTTGITRLQLELPTQQRSAALNAVAPWHASAGSQLALQPVRADAFQIDWGELRSLFFGR